MADRGDEALALVHRGWDHLRKGRPLAAWAAWHQAQRQDRESQAAGEALNHLREARDLPRVARGDHRFQPPADAATRQRWERHLEGSIDPHDLDRAGTVFSTIAAEFPGDHAALYNLALCRAWQGDNATALATLDAYVSRVAGADPEAAINAWVLAELLRHGAGAEPWADDLNHIVRILLGSHDEDPLAALSNLQPVPLGPDAPVANALVFEWLDRPIPSPESLHVRELPRVLATLVRTPGQLRLSSPDPEALAEALERLGPLRTRAERTATPLPLPLLDAALWTFRLPGGLDQDTRHRLMREAMELRLETVWIHWPRHGLDGLTPRAASRVASTDSVMRAKLGGVIRFREQLGRRPRSADLYRGYPWDRLRRRLGLPLDDPETVDARDFSCAGQDQLAKLEPDELDDRALAEAYQSAVGLRDDSLVIRLGSALISRGLSAMVAIELRPLFAALVRQALAADRLAEALTVLDRAVETDTRHRDDYDTWRAEIEARSGRPEAATRTYSEIVNRSGDSAQALAAAETLQNDGYPDFALILANRSRELAHTPAERARAEGLIASLRDGLTS